MKLFRFMSNNEFSKYCLGEKLINKTNHHKKNGFKTTSIGFCFLDLEEFKPEEILHCLLGAIPYPEICAVFEVNRKKVHNTKGKYANYVRKTGNNEDVLKKILNRGSFIANEYCTTNYSNEDFKLLKYTIPDYFNEEDWKWVNGDWINRRK